MQRNKLALALSLIAGTLLIASIGFSANEGHRTLNVTVTEIKGENLFFKTEEGTTRNISLKVVEKYEQIKNVKVGDLLVMEFDEGNQVIHINRPDRSTVSGQIVKFDSKDRTVTLKLKDEKTATYTVIPAAASKLAGVPEGTNIILDIDLKNNFVKDFERLK